jgi:PKD repeat protein
MRKSIFSLLAIFAMATLFVSCSEDDPIPEPTVKLKADIDPDDQYSVILTVEATDAKTISWNYDDGNIAVGDVTNPSHTYTYDESGDYTITVTVENESGTASATADVTINPSLQEMIAGVDAAGKTWVMTKSPASNDGAGPLHPSNFDVITLPFALVPESDVLKYVGFPNEYDNEFTFKPDGSYTVDNVNGQNLCTQIFGFAATGGTMEGVTIGQLGFASMAYAIQANSTWAVEEGATIAITDAMSDDPATASEYTKMDVSYADVTKLSITGGYFGILDISNNVIIESITPEKMQVVILMHTEHEVPSIFSRITFVPKQ